jgi:hypothetical protein
VPEKVAARAVAALALAALALAGGAADPVAFSAATTAVLIAVVIFELWIHQRELVRRAGVERS